MSNIICSFHLQTPKLQFQAPKQVMQIIKTIEWAYDLNSKSTLNLQVNVIKNKLKKKNNKQTFQKHNKIASNWR